MNFKTYFNLDETFDEDFDSAAAGEKSFKVQDIKEILDELEDDEIQELGEFIAELLDYDDDDEEIDEAKYFNTKKRQVEKNKRKDISQRKKDARKRKQWYRKNKNKVKKYNKKARKKRKMNKTVGGKRVTTHR